MSLTLPMIQDARERIRPHLSPTPLVQCHNLERALNYTNGRIFIKCEQDHPTGSFKVRGAFNNMLQLTEEERHRGVITRSSGNFAQAVAFAADRLKIRATIVIPSNAPKTKVEGTKKYRPEILTSGVKHEEGEEVVEREAKARGLVKLHPYNTLRTMAGQGTCGLEVFEQLNTVSHFFCPIGGGGLLSGCAAALKNLKPNIAIHGIEPEGAADYYEARKKGKLIPWEKIDTIADGLRASHVGELNYPILNQYVDRVDIVSDSEITSAMKLIFEMMQIVIEPSGAVALAGFIKNREKLSGDVVILLSGKNVDPDFFDTLINSK